MPDPSTTVKSAPRLAIALGAALLLAAALPTGTLAQPPQRGGPPDKVPVGPPDGKPPNRTVQGGDADGLFRWVGTFDIIAGNGSEVAEIIDVTRNGKQLVYTDGDKGEIGFVDISDPFNPRGQGTVFVGGEPTSLVVLDPLVLVGTNTSESFTDPSGQLVVVHRNNRKIFATYELGGQPDAVALSPDRKRLAIAIENERDEDLGGGFLPQLPSGTLLIFDLRGSYKKWNFIEADLGPVMDNAFAGTDLETEFVDWNEQNEIVVSFQENNHFAVVDGITGDTLYQFSGGSVPVLDIDNLENELIELEDDITKRREPDAVAWLDESRFASANEGDYEDMSGDEGGSRSFTIYHERGTVLFEAAETFEHLLVSAGHYKEDRSENKGCEPEGVEAGTFGGRILLFVSSERCNAVVVYDVTDVRNPGDMPIPLQALPTGIEPEGLKVVEKRNLLAVSTEEDEAGDGIPTMINLYRAESGPAYYPGIVSEFDFDDKPAHPWVALSDLVGDPGDEEILYTVSDSFLAEGFVYTIDKSTTPATIVDRLQVNPLTYTNGFDFEGIAVGPDGYFWVGSEGQTPGPGRRENVVLKVDPINGDVVEEIFLPAGLTDMRRGNGIEGIAVTGATGEEVIYVAIQRAWPDEGDTDEVNTKIGRYDVSTDTWGFVHYPLEPEGNGDWIGLSSLTLLPDGTFAVIERDKGWGPTTPPNAELKAIFGVDLANAEFRAYDDPSGLVTIGKTLLRDLLPDLQAVSVWTAEKVEGFAVAADGQTYVVVDNDGVDGATGETVFLRLGSIEEALDLP